ncbi:hypothetical protein PanWU01x14_191710 [Parasponia andersonii]|uniref:Uncharacterized protein n=1 Tax=Parasponia andersonii TaxID=3476 RepID=A0A2P5C1P9_PARAD|nr:hypothetical protein PanWU01x14_191710 [Parasponia andersonii]
MPTGLVPTFRKNVDNLPFYVPCSEELKLEIEKQGSYFIHLGRPRSFPVDWNSNTAVKDNQPYYTTAGVLSLWPEASEYAFGNYTDIMERLVLEIPTNCGPSFGIPYFSQSH